MSIRFVPPSAPFAPWGRRHGHRQGEDNGAEKTKRRRSEKTEAEKGVRAETRAGKPPPPPRRPQISAPWRGHLLAGSESVHGRDGGTGA